MAVSKSMIWFTVAITPKPINFKIISLALIPMRLARSERAIVSSILILRLIALGVVIRGF